MSDLKQLVNTVQTIKVETDDMVGTYPDWRDREARAKWEQSRSDAQDQLKERLLEVGAKFSARPAVDFAISLGGIRSTSTSGIEGAVCNWLTAARKRLEMAV
ncbi:hypothetical protein [uncultured Roseibium sp.]|uniref:hypothetical protein n=1 Tax=uncultured Roseibium sp. TaxID=1936171 RepID=UPI00261F79A3|nr:hypothetical protein [uncultured Roseibium sp.]